ncbi:MAG: hypothetical protein BroJett040_00890 [Oligoflexia bacterium]|nr:MAG: hypothetical protein BroJett040_00890 [Oligoflexia bacterium]
MIESFKKNSAPPVEVPASVLSADALSGLIREFILREGTDYGAHEVEFEKKFSQVQKQISKGDVKIIFDPEEGSATLMTTRDFTRAARL